MGRFHPGLVLTTWSAVLVTLVSLAGMPLAIAAFLMTGIALLFSAQGFLMLLRRSRWLLLAVVVLFGWMTPGMPVAYLPGATSDGLILGGEQFARLLLSLAMVAILPRAGNTEWLLSGLHGLLRPLARFGISVEPFVVRLILTLQRFRGDASQMPPGTGILHLPPRHWRPVDTLLLVCVAGVIAVRCA